MRSLNCRQTIYLTFEHYILSVRMFIFVLTIDCVIYKSEFLARDTVLYTQNEASFVFLLRKVKKIKKQNKKHLELKTWYFRL